MEAKTAKEKHEIISMAMAMSCENNVKRKAKSANGINEENQWREISAKCNEENESGINNESGSNNGRKSAINQDVASEIMYQRNGERNESINEIMAA
jgi:hypothetical protein